MTTNTINSFTCKSVCVFFSLFKHFVFFSLILVVHWSCVMCVHSFTLNGTEFTTHHFDVVWKMLSNKLEKDAKIKIGNWAELIYNFVCYLQLANFTIFVIINQIMNDREKKTGIEYSNLELLLLSLLLLVDTVDAIRSRVFISLFWYKVIDVRVWAVLLCFFFCQCIEIAHELSKFQQ